MNYTYEVDYNISLCLVYAAALLPIVSRGEQTKNGSKGPVKRVKPRARQVISPPLLLFGPPPEFHKSKELKKLQRMEKCVLVANSFISVSRISQ